MAVIVAAGRGDRLGSREPKALVEVAGRTLLGHVLGRFAESGVIGQIVVVGPGDALEPCRRIAGAAARVIAGGSRRRDSVRLGLDALGDEAGLVVVHDAARPLVPVGLIRRTLEAAASSGAAIAAVPVADTVKEVDGEGRIVAQPARERLWRAQTPQAFRLDLLRRAHVEAPDDEDATDDAALVARLGVAVQVVRGAETNVKVTVPEDLVIAEALLRQGL